MSDDAAAVAVTDRGFSLGDGLFETILWEGSGLRRFPRHVERFHRGALGLSLPAPPEGGALEEIARETVKRNGLAEARCAVRLTWSAGKGPRGLARPRELTPVLIVTAAPSTLNETPVNLAVSSILRNETAPSARFKTLSRIDNVMALTEAEFSGADEAVQFNTRGGLAGGSFSNIFVVIDGQIETPAESDGALAGTVRAALIGQGLEIKIGCIDRSCLARAEAACITNALQPCRTVARLDGRALATDHPLLRPLCAASIEAR